MQRLIACALLFTLTYTLSAQKKPLDHTVYDSWQHIGERMISNDGNWVVYTIDPQQGDNELVIQSSDAKYKQVVPRGYNALITEDSRYVVFKIKPFFKDTREAKIKKKKADDMPKDSIAVIELGKEEIWKTGKVKTYKTPRKSAGWMAYHLEKITEPAAPRSKQPETGNAKRVSDSLSHIIDSLQQVILSMPKKKKKNRDGDEVLYENENNYNYYEDAEGDEPGGTVTETGTTLVLRKLDTGAEITIMYVLEYFFSEKEDKLLVEQSRNPKDSNSKVMVILYDLKNSRADTLSRGGNDFKNFTMTEDGSQVAYVAEREAKPKELQKFYKLWYYKTGMDSAILLADRYAAGMRLGMTVSEYGTLSFSKSGKRLFFGVAPMQPPRDTTLVDFEHAKVDIWHYKDDYLQTVQNFPARLREEQQRNYLTMYDLSSNSIRQLGSEKIPQVLQTNEGDGDTFFGVTDAGKRVESQWLGITRKDIYAIDVKTGVAMMLKENLHGQVYPSSTGKYIMWYDRLAKNYFVWNGTGSKNITDKIKVPLYNEEWDTPDDPNNYGVMGWHEGDSIVYLYDRYDVWIVDPLGKSNPQRLPSFIGRNENQSRRYIRTDPEERAISSKSYFLFGIVDEKTKNRSLWTNGGYFDDALSALPVFSDVSYGPVIKSKNAFSFIYTKENFTSNPDLFVQRNLGSGNGEGVKLSSINPQQSNYLWGTAELFKWKAYNGKEATGIVYKPENFDAKKKYPVIVYFYEKLSNELHDYKEPSPIRSAVNVPFFVSRGYIVFMPDIEYKTGHPGQGAYDYIVSGARALVKKGWADSTNMALQGHSWGGYQAVQVATMTKLFKAIWAGAPVANMTSAYGGIRWGSGVSRQFQYEKSQSRIGATLWEKPQLYIENSPLFHLDKVTAPMVILHNDADGAVPWYQGIELFAGLRRLGKKVWMFNYNGQGHGLSQRQDMMDYQIRMQQFFDWILKGEKPAKWITDGLPAVKKGKDWGFEIVN